MLSADRVHPSISELVRPLACSSYNYSLSIYLSIFFQLIKTLHWPPRQMPHQRFQRFDYFSGAFVAKCHVRNCQVILDFHLV